MRTAKLARKADHIPAPAAQGLKKRCACGKLTPGGERCEECRKHESEEATLRRKAVGAGPSVAPPVVGEVLRSGGEPLPAGVRSAVEGPFGRDLGHVRVHTGPQAADSARAVQARAYTVGDHVVFGAGEYSPHTPDGLWLLSHELAHTAQDGGGVRRVTEDGIPIGSDHDPAEREADSAADAVLRGERVPPGTSYGAGTVRRAPWGACPKGEVVPAIDPQVYRAAELKIVEYYVALSPNPGRVFSNSGKGAGPLKDLSVNDPFLKLTKEGFFNNLRPDTELSRPAAQTTPEARATAGLSEEELADLQEAQVPILESATKEPDILDFNTFEVYDVTTQHVRDTGDKRAKIKTYVKLLNAVLTDFRKHYKKEAAALPKKNWTAGERLKKPPQNVLLFSLTTAAKETIHICYGPTDLTGSNVGIIAYRALKGVTEPAPGAAGAYQVHAAGRTLSFQVTPNARSSLVGQPDATFVNRLEFIELIPGSPDVITARYARTGRSGQLLTFPSLLEFNVTKDRKLNPRGRTPRGFRFLYLSEGTMTLDLTDQGLTGTGQLKSSLPLLQNAPFTAIIDSQQVSLTLAADAGKIKPPIPGLRVTQASLGLQVTEQAFTAQGTLAVAFGPADKPYADGTLSVSADQNGLVVQGKVVGHVPGLDKADGEVTYKNRQLSGSLTLSAAGFKVPGVAVTGATLTGTFDDTGLAIGGQVSATLPGNIPVTLGVERGKDGKVTYTGSATINVPRLDPVKIGFTYDGEHLTGSGTTGFEFRGQRGSITVRYHDGDVTGAGTLDFKIGKATGKLTVAMSKAHRLSGKGELTYPLTDQLVGQLGVDVPEDGPVRATGGIKVTQPIVLFPAKGDHLSFFKFRRTFPIPGLALPVIGGVVVEISAELGASYEVGPGTIQSASLLGSVNLSEADPKPEVAGEAVVRIPAHAGLTLSIDGGVGVGNDFVSATTGLNVFGEAGIRGAFEGGVRLAYKDKRFTVDATAAIRAGLYLTVKLKAYVQARAGIGPFQETFRKEWELAGFKWGSGGDVAVILPVHYASDEAFKPPALSDVKTEPAGLDAQEVLKQLFGGAPPKDKPLQ